MPETEITETKLVYPEFKFWKNIYTSINKAQTILFTPSGDASKLNVVYSTPGAYYYLEGTLAGETEFIKWVNRMAALVSVSLDSLNQLRSTLKKNAVKITYGDSFFQYVFLNKDGEEQCIILQNSADDEALKEALSKGTKLKSRLSQELPLSQDILKEEICEIFLDPEGKLSKDRTKNKLLEVPSSRILSFQKQEDTAYSIRFAERDMLGHRLVGIQSASAESGLTFLQIFNTI